MTRCLVVYASKYGSTREVAQAIADGLGADLAAAGSYPDVRPYDLVVLGSPIYGGDYREAMIKFVRTKKSALSKRMIAAFITAAADWKIDPGLTGDEDELLFTQDEYAQGLAQMAGGETLSFKGFGGRLIPEDLDASDFEMLSWFYRWLMREPLRGFDLIDLPEASLWGTELREMVGIQEES
ncbi:MAG: flavodoxin domain-containing protein [Chloroflexota bacterium]|nr:flavodoxin domain-containing protein [Chloroflexota bacterium]